MSVDDAFLKRLIGYKRELCKIFGLVGTKLIFLEYHLKDKKHFDLTVFPVREAEFEPLKAYLNESIEIYRGEDDCKKNLKKFQELDLVSIQKKVSVIANGPTGHSVFAQKAWGKAISMHFTSQ